MKECTESRLINLDVFEIQKYQLNRYPCLFVDFIKEVNVGKDAIGIKRFSVNEWFYQAFPDGIVPNYIVCEACEHVFLMTFLTIEPHIGKKTSTISLSADFINDVHFGEELVIKSELKSFKRGLAIGKSYGYVNDELVCKVDFMVNLPEIMESFRPKAV